MQALLIAILAGVLFLIAYHTYGRWLGSKIFNLARDRVCPSEKLNDGTDYVPTPKAVVFGHHFTSIAGTGPIVGPAIAVMWGWLPALLWVVFGSIFIGAVHDFGSLVVSLRNNGMTVGDIAGRLINRRVRLLFLLVLFMALTIVLAIFGIVIAGVFKMYPTAIFPCLVQIPIAVVIGMVLYRKGVNLLVPSVIALALMYLTVIYGDWGPLHSFNTWLASWPIWFWVVVLLMYSYIASVLPVWTLLQPRDYINSLQLISALGLIVIGIAVAAIFGGAPPVEGAERIPLKVVAPMFQPNPPGAPAFMPFLFITIACGAISGFHCLVSSGTSSKQLKCEPDARFVGYGSMLTEGFLATLVILACVAGLGLGSRLAMAPGDGGFIATSVPQQDELGIHVSPEEVSAVYISGGVPGVSSSAEGTTRSPRTPGRATQVKIWDQEFLVGADSSEQAVDVSAIGTLAFSTRYSSWSAAGSLGKKVGAFVDGSANFLKSFGIPAGVAIALMGVLVASFAGTTLDTACRLQRYIVQELAATLLPRSAIPKKCHECGYDLTGNESGTCPECALAVDESRALWDKELKANPPITANPITWLRNRHGATIFAVVIAAMLAAVPVPGDAWSLANAGQGGKILWPLFGATNQLLGGLAFLVVAFYLWRRGKPVWFLVLPMLFMLVMPMWAMIWNLFVGNADSPSWLTTQNWVLIAIGVATVTLEVWMVIEAVCLFPRVRAVLEPDALDGAAAASQQAGSA
ncbi:MAG: carbon starvation protein A [Planctomycetes bacterium]|nr:carbon starvation protein A [Planctomycetota bacterium]NOG54301.1 carbon starvation protein A [Planctomycetota bacterium]